MSLDTDDAPHEKQYEMKLKRGVSSKEVEALKFALRMRYEKFSDEIGSEPVYYFSQAYNYFFIVNQINKIYN